MGSVNEYFCTECKRTDERMTLLAGCVELTKHCPMKNKSEQVDEAGDWISKPPENANQQMDPTNPAHYRQGDVECIEAIKAATIELTGEEAYCTGCAIKYLWRWKRKGGVEDLRKARWYINRLVGDEPCTNPTDP